MPVERRGQVIAVGIGATGNGRSPMINGRRQPSSDGTSRMTRECQVRICEGLEVQFLGPTRPAHPTAEWLANQLTEACGWEQIPHYLIRDRDRAYGEIFVRRVRSIGIRDRPTSFRSPWQKRVCGETCRLNPTRVPRPCHRLRRAPSPDSATQLPELLQ